MAEEETQSKKESKKKLSKKKLKFHRAELFRNEAIDFMGRLFADFNRVYYGHDPRYKDPDEFDDDCCKYDGLIRTSAGFFRAFEDVRNGTRVLLHSYEYENLIPEKDEEGNWRLPDSNRVYVVPEAVGRFSEEHQFGYDKGRLLDDILRDYYKELIEMSQNHLNLYSMDLTPFCRPKEPNCGRVLKLGNAELAYGLFEQEDGSYRVRLYVEDDKIETKDIDKFVPIDEKPPKGFMGEAFSIGQGAGDFEDLTKALEFCYKDWNDRATRIWSGYGSLTAVDKIKAPKRTVSRMTANSWKKIMNSRAYRALVAMTVVAAAASVVTTVSRVAAAAILGVAFRGAGQAVQEYIAEVGIVKAWDRLRKDQITKASHYDPKARKLVAERYMEDTPQRDVRWCPRVDPDVIQHLRPMSQNETGIASDQDKYTAYSELHNPDHWLATIQNKLFASHIAPMNSRMGTAICPKNGLVGLFHVSANSQVKTSYLSVRPDFSYNGDVLIPEESLERLKAGIVKVVHKTGQAKPTVKHISYKQFTQEARSLVKESNFEDSDDIEQDLRHVHCLFNETAGAQEQLAEFSDYMKEKYPETQVDAGEYDLPMWFSMKWIAEHAELMGFNDNDFDMPEAA